VELLRTLVPKAALVGMLFNGDNPNAELQVKDARDAAQKVGLNILLVSATNDREIDTAFTKMGESKVDGLIVAGDPYLGGQHKTLGGLAMQYGIPVITNSRDFVTLGALVSYGNRTSDAYYQVGIYAGRILKGAKPGDLPVLQPTKFELVINLKTARALGIAIPPSLLAVADEVIE
jgi:putative tryptophan/tyrosine transport system substrate-binding protein